MNVIANTCIGARLYQVNNLEYTNPFMWSIVTADDMIKLIENFDTINFRNYKIEKSDYYNRTETYRRQFAKELSKPYFIFKIRIDDLFDIHFVHYRYNENYEQKTVIDVNVFWNRIWEYVSEKYERRTEKMLASKEDPIFVITALESDYTFEKQQQILNLETNYKILLISNEYEKLKNTRTNTKVKKIISPVGTCTNLAKTYNYDILNF